jgi:hypothetical protein
MHVHRLDQGGTTQRPGLRGLPEKLGWETLGYDNGYHPRNAIEAAVKSPYQELSNPLLDSS